jgi:hypothetical protein
MEIPFKKIIYLFLLFILISDSIFGQVSNSQPIAFHNQTWIDNKLDNSFERNYYGSESDSNVTIIGRWAYGPCDAVDVSDNIAFFSNGSYLEIADISNPATPIELSKILLPRSINDIVISDSFAYVADGVAGLRIIDISNLTNPVESGFYDTAGQAKSVDIVDNHVYLADGDAGLRIIDISNPAIPTEVGYYNTGDYATDVYVYNDNAYVTYALSSGSGQGDLRIIDISNPSNPFERGLITLGEAAEGVVVEGTYAYVAVYIAFAGANLSIVDISDPENPALIVTFGTSISYGVELHGSYAFCELRGGVGIIDISDPTNPTALGYLDAGGGAKSVSVKGTNAYVAGGYNGLRIFDISDPTNPAEIGYFATGHHRVGAIAIEGSYAYNCLNFYLGVMDISDLTNPIEIASHEIVIEHGIWGHDVSGNYLYTAVPLSGLGVIDISDPANPIEIGYFNPNGMSRDVVICSTYAYMAYGSGGLRIMDISNPLNPMETGYFDIPGFYASAVDVNGSYAYVAYGQAGLQIFDISNPANPIQTGGYYMNGDVWAVRIAVNGSYACVGVDSVLSNRLWIIDISNPSNPALLSSIGMDGFVQDLEVIGNYAYIAIDNLGLSIIDISDPLNPTKAGFFLSSTDNNHVTISDDYIFYSADGLYILQNDLISGIDDNADPFTIIENFLLEQNYPNPFNVTTTINYKLKINSLVKLSIFDITGREVKTLVKQNKNKGKYSVTFNASELSSGIYIYKFTAGSIEQSRKMLLLK